jgi:hypothetical protein
MTIFLITKTQCLYVRRTRNINDKLTVDLTTVSCCVAFVTSKANRKQTV